MPEKRYEYCRGKYRHYIQDVEKDGAWREGYLGTYGEFDLDKITELLNKFDSENKRLKIKNKGLQSELQIFKEDVEYNNKICNKLSEENEQLKERINSRLHFYRELYDYTNDSIVKRVVDDLEDILKR